MKLFAFDMDGTLLEGRTILYLAKAFGFYDDAVRIIESDIPKKEISQSLAAHLAGVRVEDFIDVVEKIPLMKGASETVSAIRSMGHKTAIITDSYTLAAEHFKRMLGMDDAVGNRLEVLNGKITGELHMPLNCMTPEACNHPSICKKETLKSLCNKYNLKLSGTIAIGDNLVDGCMLKAAGLGIAFDPKDKSLEDQADVVIREKDLREVLKFQDSF